MRITFNLRDRDPQAQDLVRRLSAAAAQPRNSSSIQGFPFGLLEALIRAGLDAVEFTVACVVDAVAWFFGALRRLITG